MNPLEEAAIRLQTKINIAPEAEYSIILHALREVQAEAFEDAIKIADSAALSAFMYEDRNEKNEPGSIDFPRNAYTISVFIRSKIRERAAEVRNDVLETD